MSQSDVYVNSKTFNEIKNKKFYIDVPSGTICGEIHDMRIIGEISIQLNPVVSENSVQELECKDLACKQIKSNMSIRLSSIDIIFKESISYHDIPILTKMFNDDPNMITLHIVYRIEDSVMLRGVNAPRQLTVSKTDRFNNESIDNSLKRMIEYSELCNPLCYYITYNACA